ncbi:hypothetical protein ABH922_000903 [Rhodococcus sp. 27YEA15]|uniref:hypothetical protein n=1 Tax=Rhodococcus sp. 27YEA15 TaxID=3156259 RepID=UPI003C7B9662
MNAIEVVRFVILTLASARERLSPGTFREDTIAQWAPGEFVVQAHRIVNRYLNGTYPPQDYVVEITSPGRDFVDVQPEDVLRLSAVLTEMHAVIEAQKLIDGTVSAT